MADIIKYLLKQIKDYEKRMQEAEDEGNVELAEKHADHIIKLREQLLIMRNRIR